MQITTTSISLNPALLAQAKIYVAQAELRGKDTKTVSSLIAKLLKDFLEEENRGSKTN